jgi:hypothetical protein
MLHGQTPIAIAASEEGVHLGEAILRRLLDGIPE